MAFAITAYSEAPFSAEDPNVIVHPLGIELTAQENASSITGNADVSVTGIGLTGTLASVTATPNTIATPSGQEMTMQEGQADATDASAELTGIQMTATLGSVKNIMWSEVNTGTAPTWTEVDTAA